MCHEEHDEDQVRKAGQECSFSLKYKNCGYNPRWHFLNLEFGHPPLFNTFNPMYIPTDLYRLNPINLNGAKLVNIPSMQSEH